MQSHDSHVGFPQSDVRASQWRTSFQRGMKPSLQTTIGCTRCDAASWVGDWNYASKEDIDTSKHFTPQAAAWEPEPPEVINHWLLILQEEGLLAECHPDQFTAEPDWVPLYTKGSLEKHLPATLSTFVNSGPPSLTAVVPPNFHMGIDREFLLTNFHQLGCLVRESISIGGKYRQMAFCPYCGVINENSETALSHVRKHLNLLFVCGGCYSESFSHGQALHKHMKSQCHSVKTIRDKTRSSQR